MLVLLNPPSGPEGIANREGTAGFGVLSAGFVYPPHTLATTLAACREAGSEARVVDAVGDKLALSAFLDRVREAKPDVLAMHSAWGTVDVDRTHVQALREPSPAYP